MLFVNNSHKDRLTIDSCEKLSSKKRWFVNVSTFVEIYAISFKENWLLWELLLLVLLLKNNFVYLLFVLKFINHTGKSTSMSKEKNRLGPHFFTFYVFTSFQN